MILVKFMENQGIHLFFKDMKKEEIPEFFDRLKYAYGTIVYYSVFRKKLETSFDEIVAANKLEYVLNALEAEYVGSVKIGRIRREGMKAEEELRRTSALLAASAHNLAKESGLFTKAAVDLAKKVQNAQGIVKKGIADITGIYSEEVLKKAKPRNKLPA